MEDAAETTPAPLASGGVPSEGAAQPTRGVTWNEGVIAEHDKERGTRRKILEPKTPFRPSTHLAGSAASVCSVASEDDTTMNEVPPDQLAAALQSALDGGSESGSGSCNVFCASNFLLLFLLCVCDCSFPQSTLCPLTFPRYFFSFFLILTLRGVR